MSPKSRERTSGGGIVRPLSLELEGFLSWRDRTTVDLADVSAAAIIGENGAGKTSLVEAIGWALFGKGRGRGPDDYIAADRLRAEVEFTFAAAGETWIVRRIREREGRTALGLFRRDHDGATTVPAGGDQIAETQAKIEELLGVSYETWIATTYIGQGKADTFTRATPAARKGLLAEILELDRYLELGTRAHALAREATGSLEEIRRVITTADATLEREDAIRADLTNAQIARAEAEAELRRVRDRHAEAARVRTEAERNAERIAEVRRLDAEVARLGQVAEAGGDLERERMRLEEELETLRLGEQEHGEVAHAALLEGHALNERQQELRRRKETAKARLAQVRASEGSCFTCGQELDTATRWRIVEGLERELEEIRAAYGDRERASEDAARRADWYGGKAREIKAQIRDREIRLRQVAVEFERVGAAGREADRLEQERTRILAALGSSTQAVELDELRDLEAGERKNLATAEQTFDSSGPAVGRAEEALRALEETSKQALELRSREEQLQAASEELSVIAEAYGRDGIPALLIDRAVPEIEIEANAILRRLTSGRFSLELRSQRAKKAGGLRETLDVVVGDEVSERALEALSGGERQCVDLALRIALARMLAHRAGRPLELLVIDEGFTALDAEHRQRTIEILHGLLGEFPVLLFVTHLTELADAFPTRLAVTRGESGSQLEVSA